MNVEGSTKNNDVRLQITHRCSKDVQDGSSDVLPLGAHTDLISAVSALLSDYSESLDRTDLDSVLTSLIP